MTRMQVIELGLQVAGLIIAIAAFLAAQTWILKAIIRDTMMKVLVDYERKEESQLRWEGHRREVDELRTRYDQELVEIRRRLGVIEEVVNHHNRR